MWASATGFLPDASGNYKLSYPLTCGLLQRFNPELSMLLKSCHTHSHVGFCNFISMITCQIRSVVIPTHMWASATKMTGRYYVENCCHTHSHVGFCNRRPYEDCEPIISCHTHSHVGFCNKFNFDLVRSSCCHTHSHVGFCNLLNHSSDLVMLVVIPTHMWASATFRSKDLLLRYCCHTHSHVGFCNNGSKFADMLAKLSYPLTCGLLQPSDWQSIVEMFRTSINDKPTPSCYFRKYT